MTDPASPGPRLETIDFGRYSAWRTVLPGFIATVVGFGTPIVLFTTFIVRDLSKDTPNENVLRFGVPLVLAFVLIASLTMFYGVFSAYRYTLLEEGVRIRTWKGVRTYPWPDAKRAHLRKLKYAVALVVSFGGLRRVAIQLHDYRKARSLLDALRARLPVPVAGHPVVEACVTDVLTR